MPHREHTPREGGTGEEKPGYSPETPAANEEVFPVEVANKLFESRAIIDKFIKEAGQIEKLREIRSFFEKILKNLGNRDLNEEKEGTEKEKSVIMNKRMKAVKLSLESEIREINKLI